MNYYFAPLEGITGYNFRRAHHQFFPGITAYYTPFVVATYTKKLKSREKRDVLPENNAGVPTIPQILTGRADEFLHCARFLAEFGYPEINLNLGCPVGTVTAKGKGSGMLRTPDEMDRFLDSIFEGAEAISVSGKNGEIHPLRISVKTRLGWEEPSEFDALLSIYERYPLSELIVHARTRQELYRGKPELAAFARAFSRENPEAAPDGALSREDSETTPAGALSRKNPEVAPDEALSPESSGASDLSKFEKRSTSHRLLLCYNGDVRTEADLRLLAQRFPGLSSVMIGRGLLANPNLIARITKKQQPDIKTFRAFHDTLYAAYDEQFHDDRIRINCMKEVWTFLGESFQDTGRYVKNIHKASGRIEYEAAVRMLFANCPLKEISSGLAE